MRKLTTKAILLGAILLASTVAHAQYAWIDEKGVRHYSDQPPPTSTPDAKILKTPRGLQRAPAADASAPAPAAPAAPAKAAPTLADREADYKKRQAATGEADKKAADEQKAAAAKRANCQAAAQNKAQFDTGRRLRDTTTNVVITDADKAREMGQIDKVLKDCK